MGVGAGLYMYDVVVKMFTFAILSPDEFLYIAALFYILFTLPNKLRLRWRKFTKSRHRFRGSLMQEGANKSYPFSHIYTAYNYIYTVYVPAC